MLVVWTLIHNCSRDIRNSYLSTYVTSNIVDTFYTYLKSVALEPLKNYENFRFYDIIKRLSGGGVLAI